MLLLTLFFSGLLLHYSPGDRFINDTAITVSNLIDIRQNGNLMMAVIDFTSGFVFGDMLYFTDQNGITGEYLADRGILTLKGDVTTENYEKAIRTVTFKATQSLDWKDEITAHTRTIRFNVTDSGGAVSDVKTRQILLETANRVYTTWVSANIREDRA